MSNPLLEKFNTPFDTIPFDKIKPKHFEPAFEELFSSARIEIESIWKSNNAPTFENTLVALERSASRLGRIASVLYNLNVAETGKEIQEVTRNISPKLAEFRNDIILNQSLFERIKTVYEESKKGDYSIEDWKLLDKTYKDFVRNGANLDETSKKRYREITQELSQLTVDFGENVLAETNNYFLHITDEKDLSGLPEDVIDQAHMEAESRELNGWVFTLQFPSYGPFMKYADNRQLRKQVFFAYAKRSVQENAYNNTGIIEKIVNLRLELANILGFKTYSDFVLSNRMAERTEKVWSFLDDLLKASMPVAQKEVEEMQHFAAENGLNDTLQIWDWSYYSEKLKKAKFDIDDEMTRPYFQLEKVEKGVFDLAKQLFGLYFRQNNDVPIYHNDVKVFEVYDEKNTFISLLYMDYFPRESKKGGAWMTEYEQQHITRNGENVRPHVSLVFNFTKPTKTKPSLLTYTEVTTLLHEFGHALHGMLSNCTYESLAGTNVYRDFVELPSQLLENWADQKKWLNQIASHFETGEKIPDELADKIIASKNFHAGYFSARQLSFGITDMKWHTLSTKFYGDVISFENDAMEPTTLLPKAEGTAMSPAFSHIFAGGYAAGYYSYKWAEVLDADAFALFRERGIFDKKTATSFKENILSKGGTEHPMDLYVRFRGKEPTIDALLERSGLK
jgi:peptidyl-dipeptidase Dcp